MGTQQSRLWRALAVALALALVAAACGGSDDAVEPDDSAGVSKTDGHESEPEDAAEIGDTPQTSSEPSEITTSENESEPEDPQSRILSAYYGLDALGPGVNRLCPTPAEGEDGMPVVFSVQINQDTVTADLFAVETASGEVVTPLCASLRPAIEQLEQRTVLLAGPFGTPDAQPQAVEVVGALEDVNGVSLLGERITNITPLEAGPSLVLAERFTVDTPGLVGECPAATQQVVQITWDGGVSGPEGSALGEPQRLGVSVNLEDGESITPIALADDDPDNHVLVCLDTATPAVSVRVEAGLFYDPGDDANLQTDANVTIPAGSIDVVEADE